MFLCGNALHALIFDEHAVKVWGGLDTWGRVESPGKCRNKLISSLFLSSLSGTIAGSPSGSSKYQLKAEQRSCCFTLQPSLSFWSFPPSPSACPPDVCLTGVPPAQRALQPLCACLSSLRAKRRGPHVLHYSYAFLLLRPFITATPRSPAQEEFFHSSALFFIVLRVKASTADGLKNMSEGWRRMEHESGQRKRGMLGRILAC